jgi:ABC-2 type transport system ATP-binding protein
MMPKAYKDQVRALAEMVGLEDGLFTKIGKLSGGMKRKLEIMRSMIHTPKILFLDEPTQGLDAMSRRNVWDYINRMREERGTTVFLTTHYIEEAEAADRICLIDHGKIRALGTPDDIKEAMPNRDRYRDEPTLEDAYVEMLREDLEVMLP